MNLISTLIKIVHCFLIKIVHCFLHKLFLAFNIKLFSVQHYLKNCSLSFLHKLFYVHCFLIKHLVKSCFLNLKAKSECFFMFKFHQVFYEKTTNNFLNCEQRIIYVEKSEQFLNNAGQKIILCRMLEIVYAENSEQFYLMQKIVLLSEHFYIQLI